MAWVPASHGICPPGLHKIAHSHESEPVFRLHLRRLRAVTSGPSHKTAVLLHHACRLDLPKLEGIIFSLLCSSTVEVRQGAVEALVTLRALHRQVAEQQLSGGLSGLFLVLPALVTLRALIAKCPGQHLSGGLSSLLPALCSAAQCVRVQTALHCPIPVDGITRAVQAITIPMM